VAGVAEVDDAHIGLAGVFSVQAARVLLQRAFPGNRRRQYQGIQRRVIETCQGEMDGVEMLCALGQHQYLAALLEGPRDFCGYGFSPGEVMDQIILVEALTAT
jgi:hypothetical protein